MESGISNKQRIIQTQSDVFWIIQFTRNISKNDKQYIPRATIWRSTGKLYRQLCDICKNKKETGRKDNMFLKDGTEI